MDRSGCHADADTDADAVEPLLAAMSGLLDRPGAFVNGSNDYWAPRPRNPLVYLGGPTEQHGKPQPLPTTSLTDGMSRAGWIDLNNQRGDLVVAGQKLSFVGVDDPHIRRDKFPASGPVSRTHIGVAHAPYQRVLEAMSQDGADIVFAGHTHGGQVRVPGFGALVTNCDLPRWRARGLSIWPARRGAKSRGTEDLWLHVSAGAGTNPYTPFRFACRPEATLVTLLPKDAGPA